MGCFWSDEGQVERCHECNRKAKNYLVIVNNICEICSSKASPRQSVQIKPRFGLYHCSCGRRWDSRGAWKNAFQKCNRCQKEVYPYELRELRPGDLSNDVEKDKGHKRELCQMCTQLGRSCGSGYAQPRPQPRTNNRTRGKRYYI